MTNHERPVKHEGDPRLLDRHMRGLRKTSEDIKDFHMLTRLGDTGLHERIRTHSRRQDSRKERAGIAKQYLEKSGVTDPDARMYASLISVVPSMIEGRRTLQSGKSYGTQNYSAKMKMIEFNNALRTIADTHPSLEPEIVVALVRSIALDYRYDADDVNAATIETRESSVGIIHELGVESELYWLSDEFQVLDTTNRDDKKGADFKVLYRPTGTIVGIDGKASERGAEQAVSARKDHNYYSGHGYTLPRNELILYSGFTKQDIDPNHPWRVKPEAIQREYPRLEGLIREAAGGSSATAPQGVR